MRSKLITRKSAPSGFSLVELLVAIAVIGVLAALAIPAMSGIFNRGRESAINQNAQNLATMFSAARAAGATFPSYDKDTVIDTLTGPAGVQGSGTMANVVFRLPLGTEQITAVKSSTQLEPFGTGQDFVLLYTGP